jgi:hypothetical protein
MANISPAQTIVHPSFIEPGVILPYAQASGAFEALYDGQPLARLGEGDLYVYMKRIDVRTRVAVGQSAYNNLPSISTTMNLISTASYLLRVRAEYDHHDTTAMGKWGINLPEAQRLGMRQAHFQMARIGLLYGYNPANGEGLLNTNGAVAVSLPADSNGNTSVHTYDAGQMAFFILSQIQALKTRTNQLGIGRKFVIIGPQQDMAQFEYSNIVSLTQFQSKGAGSTTTAGVIKDVLEWNNDEIVWAYDDTLLNKGAGGTTDAIIIVMPEIQKPQGSKINTNEFAKLAPGIEACTLMYCDMAAPREIPTPLPGGATDVLSEWRTTSGWGIRPEAITIISMQF